MRRIRPGTQEGSNRGLGRSGGVGPLALSLVLSVSFLSCVFVQTYTSRDYDRVYRLSGLRPLSAASGEQDRIDAQLRAELDCALVMGRQDGSMHPGSGDERGGGHEGVRSHAAIHHQSQQRDHLPPAAATVTAAGAATATGPAFRSGPPAVGAGPCGPGTGPAAGGRDREPVARPRRPGCYSAEDSYIRGRWAGTDDVLGYDDDRERAGSAAPATRFGDLRRHGGGPEPRNADPEQRGRTGRRRRRRHSSDGGPVRRRHSSDGGPARRRRRDDLSSSSESESDEEDGIDRRVEYRAAPTRSRTGAAPTALRLPAIQVRAERRLRNRRLYVSVEEAYDAAEGRPNTAME